MLVTVLGTGGDDAVPAWIPQGTPPGPCLSRPGVLDITRHVAEGHGCGLCRSEDRRVQGRVLWVAQLRVGGRGRTVGRFGLKWHKLRTLQGIWIFIHYMVVRNTGLKIKALKSGRIWAQAPVSGGSRPRSSLRGDNWTERRPFLK